MEHADPQDGDEQTGNSEVFRKKRHHATVLCTVTILAVYVQSTRGEDRLEASRGRKRQSYSDRAVARLTQSLGIRIFCGRPFFFSLPAPLSSARVASQPVPPAAAHQRSS